MRACTSPLFPFNPAHFVFYSIFLLFFPVQKAVDDCTVCGQPIKGDAVESNNKSFHPECMKCYVCGDSLGRLGPFFTFQDKPICERDYKVLHTKRSSKNL